MWLEGGQPDSPEATHEGCLMAQDRLHPEGMGGGDRDRGQWGATGQEQRGRNISGI